MDPVQRHLRDTDPVWAALFRRVAPCAPPRPARGEIHAALVHAVAHQQLHGRAAAAILKRFLALYPDHGFPAPAQILATDAPTLRACGFSTAKIAAIRVIAEAARAGVVPTRREARSMSDAALIERLTRLRGVGRWTVEMLLINHLGRPDVLPVHDLGVREGWRLLKGLPHRPTPAELDRIGTAWSPFRSTATRYLWRAADQV